MLTGFRHSPRLVAGTALLAAFIGVSNTGCRDKDKAQPQTQTAPQLPPDNRSRAQKLGAYIGKAGTDFVVGLTEGTNEALKGTDLKKGAREAGARTSQAVSAIPDFIEGATEGKPSSAAAPSSAAPPASTSSTGDELRQRYIEQLKLKRASQGAPQPPEQ